MSERHGQLAVIACVLITACSSADNAAQRNRGDNAQAGAGAGASASPTSGTGAGAGDFGNTMNGPPVLMEMGDAQVAPPPPSGGGRTPMSLDDCGAVNPAGLAAADAQALMAGSGSPGALRLLNPYDGTVFPRGILPPTLMWDGDTGTQYVYVHIKSRLFEYKGCFTPTAPGQLLLPEAAWSLAGDQTEGNVDPYVVELSVMGGGSVTGPVSQRWTIAQATLKGSIYYNSYSSQLAGVAGFGGGSGAVLRIPRGKSAEAFLGQTGCTGCHSVSANGGRMVALPLGGIGLAGNSSSYELTPDGMVYPAPLSGALANGAFTGLSPDGTLFVTSAHGAGALFVGGIGPRAGGPGAMGGPTAGLFETDTATEVPGSGLVTGAMMTTFAPDATQIAFTDLAISNGHGLAVMAFDMAGRKASAYRQIYATGDDTKFPGWPFFLPDGKALVFAIGTAADFSGMGAGIGMGGGLNIAGAPTSDLYIVDTASGEPKVLAQAMGFASEQDAASGATYLPFGAEELHHHYYPTVAPVAAGGYFWVFFDSIRHYGNQGMQRQIWGTAVDVSADGTYHADTSHPAFYLTGQEAGTGNHRAFAALDPCEMDGETCTSGTDCCGGFCYVPEMSDEEFASEPVGTCTAEVPECSRVNDCCSDAGDCCEPEPGKPAVNCIAGFCAMLQKPE